MIICLSHRTCPIQSQIKVEAEIGLTHWSIKLGLVISGRTGLIRGPVNSLHQRVISMATARLTHWVSLFAIKHITPRCRDVIIQENRWQSERIIKIVFSFTRYFQVWITRLKKIQLDIYLMDPDKIPINAA